MIAKLPCHNARAKNSLTKLFTVKLSKSSAVQFSNCRPGERERFQWPWLPPHMTTFVYTDSMIGDSWQTEPTFINVPVLAFLPEPASCAIASPFELQLKRPQAGLQLVFGEVSSRKCWTRETCCAATKTMALFSFHRHGATAYSRFRSYNSGRSWGSGEFDARTAASWHSKLHDC